MIEEFNFRKELKKGIILESDIQNAGVIECSFSGELIPFEVVDDLFDEFIRLLKEDYKQVYMSGHNYKEFCELIEKRVGEKQK